MELQGYTRAFRRFWWLLLLSALVGAALGGAAALLTPATYAGQVTFFATTPSTDSGNALQGDQFGQQRVNTYVKLLQSQRLAERVVAESKADISTTRLMKEIEGTADLNTVLLTATVTDSSSRRALSLVTGVAQVFPNLVDDIETQNGTQKAPVHLDVVSGPALENGPVSPRKKLDVAVGLLAGLVVGIALVLLLALRDRAVRGAESLREATDAPLLASVPRGSRSRRSPLVVGSESSSGRAEAFRRLRTNVQFARVGEPVRVLVVTSANAREGRTVTAVNLALSFAETGRSVLLVDADLRRPAVAGLLKLPDGPGLTEVLGGKVDLDGALRRWDQAPLTVLSSGAVPTNPTGLLDGPLMHELVAAVRSRFDVVVLDTPPLLTVADGPVVATHADGAVLVVRDGRTTADDVERAFDALAAVDVTVLGTVLNAVGQHS